MGLAAANVLVVVCTVLATSTPSANAFPMTHYDHNLVFFQQSSTISAVTEALAVSNTLKLITLYKDQHIT